VCRDKTGSTAQAHTATHQTHAPAEALLAGEGDTLWVGAQQLCVSCVVSAADIIDREALVILTQLLEAVIEFTVDWCGCDAVESENGCAVVGGEGPSNRAGVDAKVYGSRMRSHAAGLWASRCGWQLVEGGV
jgi:hypothetical protein